MNNKGGLHPSRWTTRIQTAKKYAFYRSKELRILHNIVKYVRMKKKIANISWLINESSHPVKTTKTKYITNVLPVYVHKLRILSSFWHIK